MKRVSLVLLGALLLVGRVGIAAVPSADFYLAPNGSDQWSGTLAEPNAQKTDGPFATLQRARDAVRTLKQDASSDITVLVRGGTYRLDKTVVFSLEDSGTDHQSITYAAWPGETPVFSSGREITGWEKAPVALKGLPEVARGKVLVAHVSERFYTLYDEEGLLPRARSAQGFIPKGNKTQFEFPAGRLKNWSNIEDVEIFVRPFQAWISNMLPLKAVDEKAGKALTSISATYPMNELHYALKGLDGCWVENVLEELDEPGEWVLNTQEGKVYLWPQSQSPVVAPQLLELIRIEGDVDLDGPQDVPVRNLRFRGLTFMHGERYQIHEEDAGLQHDWDFLDKDNALVRLRGTENCAIEDCYFLHSGSGAIRVDLHGQENKISGNHIEHLGGSGILLCGYGPGTKDVNKNNFVSNNHIHHVGEIYWHSPGIFLWQSGENRVVNNLIHHTPYSGIILSGVMDHFFAKSGREQTRTIRWQEIPGKKGKTSPEQALLYLHSHDNRIEYNEIHHAMEKMGDGNGIYIRGAGANNMISRNYIHHLVAPMIMQAAIRTDGGQRDTIIMENLIYKCVAQGIICKLNTRCENNIIADVIHVDPRNFYLVLREGPMTGATLKRNILYSSNPEQLSFIDEMNPNGGRSEDRAGNDIARSTQTDCDYNIYYCTADAKLGMNMLEKQQRAGVDAHSRAVDPLFVDPENGDFRLKPDSPALEMGFVPIDLSKVGLKTK
jgi:hypothetical protein